MESKCNYYSAVSFQWTAKKEAFVCGQSLPVRSSGARSQSGSSAAHGGGWDRRDGRILRYKRRRSLIARGSALEIKELKSFCMVARLGSFSKASQMLAMGQ